MSALLFLGLVLTPLTPSPVQGSDENPVSSGRAQKSKSAGVLAMRYLVYPSTPGLTVYVVYGKSQERASALADSGGNEAGDGIWITFQRETAHESHRLLCSQLGVDFSVYRDMRIIPASPDKAP